MYKNIFIALLMGSNHIINSEDWMEQNNQTVGYSIYLTDIIKDWFAGRELDPSNDDIKLFESELAILQQSHPNTKKSIVVFGKKAEGAIDKIIKRNNTKNNLPIIRLPHPSKKNWTTWKLRIFEKAVYGTDIDYDYAKKIYPKSSSPTNEDIVSTIAINEILAGLQANP
jgi:ribosomal protein S10